MVPELDTTRYQGTGGAVFGDKNFSAIVRPKVENEYIVSVEI